MMVTRAAPISSERKLKSIGTVLAPPLRGDPAHSSFQRASPHPSPASVFVAAGSVSSHAKEAECQGFAARPTLASEAMPRWGMANVGETHFPPALALIKI